MQRWHGMKTRSIISSFAPHLWRWSFYLTFPTPKPTHCRRGTTGPAKQGILAFVKTTTDAASPNFVPPEQRIAAFDQDGTLWVEHPMYTQLIYCLERVPAVVERTPALKNVEPFKTVISVTERLLPSCRLPISRRYWSPPLPA